MRIAKPAGLESIAQVLAKGACPICALVKDDQSALVHGEIRPEAIVGLCNFHAWALAATADRNSVAQIFLNALRCLRPALGELIVGCSICQQLLERERVHIRKLVEQIRSGIILDWMREQGTFCRLHADKVRELAPPQLRPIIDEILDRSTQALKTELEDLLSHKDGKSTGFGVLGRAAEFLVSQRGIHR